MCAQIAELFDLWSIAREIGEPSAGDIQDSSTSHPQLADFAVLDVNLVGKPLLAFVHVDTKGWGKSPAIMALALLPEVEEIHSVSGDTCLILKVRTAGAGPLEDVLARIYAVPGVLRTRSYVALRSYLQHGTSPATGLKASDAAGFGIS